MASRIFTHLVLVLGLFSALSLKAQQVTFTISPSQVTPAVGDTVRLNVVVTNFTNIVSFQYAMDWDANLFQFVSVDNIDNMPDKQNLGFNNYTPSALIVGWNAVGGAPRTVANGIVIYRLNLKVKAASSNFWAIAASLTASTRSCRSHISNTSTCDPIWAWCWVKSEYISSIPG